MEIDGVFNRLYSACDYRFLGCERSHRSMLAARQAVDESWGDGGMKSESLMMVDGFLCRSCPDDRVMLMAFSRWRHMADQVILAFRWDRLLRIGLVNEWPMFHDNDPSSGFEWLDHGGRSNTGLFFSSYPIFQAFKGRFMDSRKVMWMFRSGPYAISGLRKARGFNGSQAVTVTDEIKTLQLMKNWLDWKDDEWTRDEAVREAVACLLRYEPWALKFYDALKDDPSWRVRRALILNPSLPFKMKWPFIEDPDWRVRCELVELDEPYMKMEAGERLVNDPEYEVRIRMAARMVDPMRHAMMLSRHDSMDRYLRMLEESPYDDDFKADLMMEVVAYG